MIVDFLKTERKRFFSWIHPGGVAGLGSFITGGDVVLLLPSLQVTEQDLRCEEEAADILRRRIFSEPSTSEEP